MATIESDIEKYLAKLVKNANGIYLKIPAVYMSGIPDRLVLLPYGRMAFVELKRPIGGKRAELQKYWQSRLSDLGYRSVFVQTKKEADGLIKTLASNGYPGDLT